MTFSADSAASAAISRRDVLRRLAASGLALGGAAMLPACGGPAAVTLSGNGAAAVSGGFSWKKAKGTTVRLLQVEHNYQKGFKPLLKEFTDLTGITLVVDVLSESEYFGTLGTELAAGTGAHDVFMTGAYFIWQYGPPGWMEDLTPWIHNSSATNAEYDFDDIFEGLRTSTRWNLVNGSPVGSGGQYAIPWGFETNVVAYDRELFARRGITPPQTFGNLVQLAVDLTDRSEKRYGIATRGSRSWATIHPGFMTQFARQGCVDYTVNGGRLVPQMNSSKAVAFTQQWTTMMRDGGPLGWKEYDYANCRDDLGSGTAAMVFDADCATYPLNQPGASGSRAGKMAWYPGPAGPDGTYATNLWTWSLAMNSASRNKLGAWLFLQWATGKDALTKASKSIVDPVRRSVFDSATFKNGFSNYPGYLETFEKVVGSTKIQFTPQNKFFETTEDWALAVREIFDGADAKVRLDEYAAACDFKVNG